MLTDSRGTILHVNPSFSRVTGYSQEEARGENPSLLKSGRQNEEFYRRMWSDLSKTSFWEGEIWNRRKNGTVYLEKLTVSAMKDKEGCVTNYLGIFSDITDQRNADDRLNFLAHFDILTGVPNRHLALDRLSQILTHARRHHKMAAVLFLDLDLFKKVNDSMGHSVGDQVLKVIAERFKAVIREEDTVARIGGDEFLLLLNQISKREDAVMIAKKAIQTVSTPIHLSGNHIFITTSVGISIFPQDGNNPEELLKRADQAMYQAKDQGRNAVCLARHGKVSLNVGIKWNVIQKTFKKKLLL